MPRKFKLSWHEPRNCWRKYRSGKTYYLGKGICHGKTDIDGYCVAFAEWEDIKRKLDEKKRDAEAAIGQLRASDGAVACLTNYAAVNFTPNTVSLGGTTETRIEKLAELFLSEQLDRVQSVVGVGSEGISLRMYAQYKDKIEDFVAYSKHLGRYNANEIDGILLDAYRRSQLHLITLTDGHRRSPHTAKKRLDTAKKFVLWLYKKEALQQIPRLLDSEYARVHLPKLEPKQYTVEEIRKIFNAATQRTKLYIALGLNCGYTQIDIATLLHEHIDWGQGVIRRDRNKTGAPQTHKLWPVTLALLNREMTQGGVGRMLRDEDGNELVRDWQNPKGNVTKNDVIKLAYDRAMAKAGMKDDDRRFKTLRKTSANEIERGFPETPHLSSYFLAHTEKDVKRHYVNRDVRLLFKAIDHLEQSYGLRIDPPATAATQA